MKVYQGSRKLVVNAPAKINLFLELLGKRADGYHELATLMVGVSLFDTLLFADDGSDAIDLTCSRPGLSTGPDNLIVKAAELLRSRTGVSRGASIRLLKRIPIAGGLAGGSTDAAATLLGLNRLWRTDLTESELATMAAELGSDIPFFFALPAAWCTGRGEIAQPLVASRAFEVVLILPPLGCDTASVYRQATLPAAPLAGDDIRLAFSAGDVETLNRGLHNRLEAAADIVAPALRPLRDAVSAVAPLGCRMSGSGSTLFALARNRAEAAALVRTLQTLPELAGCRIKAVRTLTTTTG